MFKLSQIIGKMNFLMAVGFMAACLYKPTMEREKKSFLVWRSLVDYSPWGCRVGHDSVCVCVYVCGVCETSEISLSKFPGFSNILITLYIRSLDFLYFFNLILFLNFT